MVTFFHHGNLVLGRVRNVLQPCLLVARCEHDLRVYIVFVFGCVKDFHKCAANWFLSSKVMDRFS